MNEVRLIDANALKESIRKRLGISSLKYLTEQERVIVEEIDNAPAVKTYCYYCGQTEHGKIEERPQGEWIPVSERLPLNCISCLFCDIDGDIYYGRHYSENNRWYAEYLDDKIPNVVAWQPLPEPYKEGGADMRKSNCVTCDHFGKCEGCERSGEE